MSSRRFRWTIAFAAVVGGGFVVSVASVAPAATAASTRHAATLAASPAASHPESYFVTGQGRVTHSLNPTALVRDNAGKQHVVTSVKDPAASGDQGHLVYMTRRRGATHWTSHAIPGLVPMAGGIQVEEHLSFNGKRVFAVFYTCKGVFVTDAPVSASRLAKADLIQARNTCRLPAVWRVGAPPVANAAALPHNNVAIVLPTSAESDQWALFTGLPGSAFSVSATLPTTDQITPLQVGYLSGGIIAVIGSGTTEAGQRGIYALTTPYYQSQWVGPTRIATLGVASPDYTVESMATAGTGIWVGLQKPHVGGVTLKHTLFLVHGTAVHAYYNGPFQWTGAFPLPHSTAQDTSLRLVVHDTTGTLHAAFTRVDLASRVKHSGIIVEQKPKAGSWKNVQFVTHWYRDYADQITFGAKGNTIVGYDQR